MNVSKESAQSVVPENLNLLLSVISKGQEAVDGYFNEKTVGFGDSDNNYNDCSENYSDDSDDEDEDGSDVEDETNRKPKEESIQSNYFPKHIPLKNESFVKVSLFKSFHLFIQTTIGYNFFSSVF